MQLLIYKKFQQTIEVLSVERKELLHMGNIVLLDDLTINKITINMVDLLIQII